MKKFKLILWLTMAILLVIFAIQNVETVVLKLFFWKVDVSLAIIVLISFAIGAILSIIVSSMKSQKPEKKKNVKNVEPKIKENEKL